MGRSAGRRGVALVVAAVLATPLAAGVAPPATATTSSVTAAATRVPDTRLVHRVRYQGRTLTLRMEHVDVRGDGFSVLLQRPGGRLVPQRVDEERTYVGTVDGRPSATASAIVRHDGTVAGAVALDRGVDLRFEGREVLTDLDIDRDPYDRGIRWPASEDAARNATVAPGGATGTYAFDLGFDLDASYFVDHLGSSVERAVDEVDQAMVHLWATYSRDAQLRPVTGRVVLRGSAERSPYAEARRAAEDGHHNPQGLVLDAAREDWNPVRSDGGWDDVMVLQSFSGGGLGYVGTLGGDYSFASSGIISGSMTRDWNVVRHELGHNVGVWDYHTDGPEDETIMSGNHFARFDGTELRSMWQLRDERLAAGGVLDSVGTTQAPLPPYAALDLLDGQFAGTPVRVRPVANDHDANGEALRLVSVDPTSNLGGTVSARGGRVTYVPPAVTDDPTTDWFRYVVADASGQRATGVAIARVTPREPLGPPTTWGPASPDSLARWTLTNVRSGLAAATPTDPRTGPPVQRGGTDAGVRWRFVPSGEGVQVVSTATKRCLTPVDGGLVEQARCAEPESTEALPQRWVVRQHPYGDTALVSLSGTCLTAGRSTTEGTALRHGRCTGSEALRWQLGPTVSPGAYRLVSAGTDRALAMPEGSTATYANLVARTGTDDATSWRLARSGPGAFVLRNRGRTDRCAYSQEPFPRGTDVPYDSTCDAADPDASYDGRLFGFAAAADGSLQLLDVIGRCIDVDDDTDGSILRAVRCDGGASQYWRLARL